MYIYIIYIYLSIVYIYTYIFLRGGRIRVRSLQKRSDFAEEEGREGRSKEEGGREREREREREGERERERQREREREREKKNQVGAREFGSGARLFYKLETFTWQLGNNSYLVCTDQARPLHICTNTFLNSCAIILNARSGAEAEASLQLSKHLMPCWSGGLQFLTAWPYRFGTGCCGRMGIRFYLRAVAMIAPT